MVTGVSDVQASSSATRGGTDPAGKTLYQLPAMTLQALENIQHRLLSFNSFGKYRKEEFWSLLEYKYEFLNITPTKIFIQHLAVKSGFMKLSLKLVNKNS